MTEEVESSRRWKQPVGSAGWADSTGKKRGCLQQKQLLASINRLLPVDLGSATDPPLCVRSFPHVMVLHRFGAGANHTAEPGRWAWCNLV